MVTTIKLEILFRIFTSMGDFLGSNTSLFVRNITDIRSYKFALGTCVTKLFSLPMMFWLNKLERFTNKAQKLLNATWLTRSVTDK